MRDIADLREKNIDIKSSDVGSKIVPPGHNRSDDGSKIGGGDDEFWDGFGGGDDYFDSVDDIKSPRVDRDGFKGENGPDLNLIEDGHVSVHYITAGDLSPEDRKLYGYDVAPDNTRIKVTTKYKKLKPLTGEWVKSVDIPQYNGPSVKTDGKPSAFKKAGGKGAKAVGGGAKAGVRAAGRGIQKVGLSQIRGWTKDSRPDMKEANAMKRGLKGAGRTVKRPVKKTTKKATKTTAKVTAKTTKTAVKITARLTVFAARTVVRVAVAAAPILLPVAVIAAILVPIIMMFSTAGAGTAVEGGSILSTMNAAVSQFTATINYEQNIWDALMEYYDNNEDIVTGIMVCLYKENHFSTTYSSSDTASTTSDPKVVAVNGESTAEKRLAKFLSYSGGFGICQWTDNTRKTRFMAFAEEYFSTGAGKGKPFDISNIDLQIAFMFHELEGTHSTTGNNLKKLKDEPDKYENVELEAACIWIRDYERPARYLNNKTRENLESIAQEDISQFSTKIKVACKSKANLNNIVSKAIEFCNDNSHGYTLHTQCTSFKDTNTDLCCAQFVCVIYNEVFPGCMPLTGSAGTLWSNLRGNDKFVDVSQKVNHSTLDGAEPGDIFIWVSDDSRSEGRHALIYVGDKKIAEASWYSSGESDKNVIKGDQGNEVRVTNYKDRTGQVVDSINGEHVDPPDSGGYKKEYLKVFRYKGAAGTLIWPTASHNVTSGFGKRKAPVEGATTDHVAIDIGIPIGTDVWSASSGEVTSTGYSSARGHYVVIKHDNGYSTRYQHLSEILCKKGDKVLEAQLIGKSGMTGICSAPHLHFEVYPPGKDANKDYPSGAIDPMTVLPQ